nr:probable F-box protein At4g22030 [Ipomoea batatas]
MLRLVAAASRRRKRPRLPMSRSSAERRKTPEVLGLPRCSAAAYGRGRRKRQGCWPAPSLCFFDRRQGREETEVTPTIYVRLAGEEAWKTFSRRDPPLEENRRATVAFAARGLVIKRAPGVEVRVNEEEVVIGRELVAVNTVDDIGGDFMEVLMNDQSDIHGMQQAIGDETSVEVEIDQEQIEDEANLRETNKDVVVETREGSQVEVDQPLEDVPNVGVEANLRDVEHVEVDTHHDGQVGMVFEKYRSNAGFFKLVQDSIDSNLEEKDLQRRENEELFEMKVALKLGRSLSELKDLAAKS